MREIETFLRSVAGFKELSPDQLEKVLPMFHMKTYRATQTIISHLDRSTDVFLIMEGNLRATLYTPAGREISYREMAKGDMLGEISAIDGLPRSAHVEALTDTKLLFITKNNFINIVTNYPCIAWATLTKLTQLVRHLTERIYQYGALDVNQRIHVELVNLAQSHGQPYETQDEILITDMPKHQELANRVTTHREAVTRALNKLEKENIIRKQGKKAMVVNITSLKLLTSQY